MLQPDALPSLHASSPLVADAGIDGWLLFDFRGRNPIAAAVLGDQIVGSRRVYVLLPPEGPPIALVHAVDAELWRWWPAGWTKRRVWITREELTTELQAPWSGAGGSPSTTRPRAPSPISTASPRAWPSCCGKLGATLCSARRSW